MKPCTILLFLLGLLSFGCVRVPLVDPEKPEDGLRVELSVTDGIMTTENILRRPEVLLTVLGGDDEATYEASFRIGGSREKVVHHIWNGIPKDLSGEFLSMNGYESVEMDGYLYDTRLPEVRYPFDTMVWMAYSPVEVTSIVLRKGETEQSLGASPALIDLMQEYLLTVTYAPSDSFVHLSVETEEGSPLAFNERRILNRDGVFSVPCRASAAGEAGFTLVETNGRDVRRTVLSALCKEPDVDDDTPAITL